MIAALAGILAVCTGLVFYLSQQNKVSNLPLHKEANCYLLTLKGSYAPKTKDGKINLLDYSDTKVADYVHYIYPRGELEGRYLLLSKGWEGAFYYPTGIVSIEFQTGKVQSHQTDHYAVTGAGQSQHYFYTWQQQLRIVSLVNLIQMGRKYRTNSMRIVSFQ